MPMRERKYFIGGIEGDDLDCLITAMIKQETERVGDPKRLREIGNRLVQRIGMMEVHLCGNCKDDFPDCGVDVKEIEYGCGIGNDNIWKCSKYTEGV